MNKNCSRFLFALVFAAVLVSGPIDIIAQSSKDDLQKKREQLLKDIEFTNKLLSETKEHKIASISQLETLRKQISIREELIKTIANEIDVISKQINEKNGVIKSLEKDLQTLKDEYAKMIVAAYKTQSSYNKLMFLFSANGFNDLYNRVKYMEKYRAYKELQATLISMTSQDLKKKLAELEAQKQNKVKLLNSANNQKATMKKDETSKNEMIGSLQKKEKELKSQIKAKEKSAEQLKKAIEDIIKKELAAAKAKKELEKTPAVTKLSADFANNQGKLPWPVEKGIITGTFGEHAHPLFSTIKVVNNGVDIKTTKGSDVLALFDGTVVSVIFNPGFHKAVIVKHGDYFTVYSNLDEAFVKPNDKVSTRQKIGRVHTDDSDGKTEVHLEIWKGTTILNPQLWLLIK